MDVEPAAFSSASFAPLPPAMIEHLLLRAARRLRPGETLSLATLYQRVREKERSAFHVLDVFVRADELSRAEVRDTLNQYGPTVAQSTFTKWKRAGCLDMERSGHVKPLSAQAVLVMRMMDPGKRSFLPPGGVPPGESWLCWVQRNPESPVEVWPSHLLELLPPSALCWTPALAPAWEPGWLLIGEGEGGCGCMRFAGIRTSERGRAWYDVSLADLARWDAAVASLFVPHAGDEQAQVQDLCLPLFHRFAQTCFVC